MKYDCALCGVAYDSDAHYGMEEAEKAKRCFLCDFWVRKIQSGKGVRIAGHHYQIGVEGSAFPGFSGRRFVILFRDGTKIVTTNLWHQGEIPERFRGELPDNAEFTE